ncbi:MAG: DUF5681 domain-containing protein [Rhizomicrobium sp.]
MAYEIGYGKPPAHTRFHIGQSGNPSGLPGPRRAGERALRASIEKALLSSPEAVAARVPRDGFDAVARSLLLAAMRGNAPAVRVVLAFVSGHERKAFRALRAACAPRSATPKQPAADSRAKKSAQGISG